MTRNTTTARLVALYGLFAALATGCKQEVLCPALDSCGGPLPIGDWVLAPGYPSCSEDLYVPATDPRLVQADLPPGRIPPPEPALFDWCLLLVTGPGMNIQVKPPRFYYEDGPVGAASVRYEANGQFTAGITRTGTFVLDFPAFCMRAFGGMDGKPAFDPNNLDGGPPVNVCKQLEAPLRSSGANEGSYPNTTCEPNPVDLAGCLCTFDVTETGGPSGSYQLLDDHTIVHIPGSNFPQKATFCNKGDSLELTGANGAYLFDVRGLRTFKLTRVTTPMP